MQKHHNISEHYLAHLNFGAVSFALYICIICLHDYPCALSSPCLRLWGGLAGRFLSRVLQFVLLFHEFLCVFVASLLQVHFKHLQEILKTLNDVWKLEFQARWTVGVSFGLLCKRRCWRISISSIHLHSTRSTKEFQHEPKFQGPTLGDFDKQQSLSSIWRLV